MNRRARIWSGLCVAALLAAPRAAGACSVCTTGREDENQLAFILTTIFMSITPLLVVGGVVFFIVRRVRAAERSQAISPARATPTADQPT